MMLKRTVRHNVTAIRMRVGIRVYFNKYQNKVYKILFWVLLLLPQHIDTRTEDFPMRTYWRSLLSSTRLYTEMLRWGVVVLADVVHCLCRFVRCRHSRSFLCFAVPGFTYACIATVGKSVSGVKTGRSSC